MSFTFYNPSPSSPEQTGPLGGLLSGALKNYSHLLNAKYLPKKIEADIFNKQIGPLATLATSPMFLNNPQFQENLGHLIAQHLGGD